MIHSTLFTLLQGFLNALAIVWQTDARTYMLVVEMGKRSCDVCACCEHLNSACKQSVFGLLDWTVHANDYCVVPLIV